MGLSFKILGWNKTRKKLLKLIDTKGRTQEVMLKAAVFAKRDIDEHFRKEEGPKGKWPPFKAGGRMKISKTGNITIKKGNLLRKTGALKNSITYTPKKTTLKIQSGEPYAKVHQEGKKVKIPKQAKAGGKAGGAFRFLSKKSMLSTSLFTKGGGKRKRPKIQGGVMVFTKTIKKHSFRMTKRPFIWLSQKFLDNVEKFIIRKFKRDMKKAS